MASCHNFGERKKGNTYFTKNTYFVNDRYQVHLLITTHDSQQHDVLSLKWICIKPIITIIHTLKYEPKESSSIVLMKAP